MTMGWLGNYGGWKPLQVSGRFNLLWARYRVCVGLQLQTGKEYELRVTGSYAQELYISLVARRMLLSVFFCRYTTGPCTIFYCVHLLHRFLGFFFFPFHSPILFFCLLFICSFHVLFSFFTVFHYLALISLVFCFFSLLFCLFLVFFCFFSFFTLSVHNRNIFLYV